MTINCVAETEPLGTAGGFINAVNQGETEEKPSAWLVLNGDSLIVADYQVLLTELNDSRVDGIILGVKVPDASRFGSLIFNEQGELQHFAEKQPGAGVINSGVYLLGDRLLAKFPEKRPLSFEYDVFPTLLEQGAKIKVHAVDAPFLDIGTPETLAQAGQFIELELQDKIISGEGNKGRNL